MNLRIYETETKELIYKMVVTPKLLNQHDIDPDNENFTEEFETEILSDIFEENNLHYGILFGFCINPDETYYELK
jgi:hypothetical protein